RQQFDIPVTLTTYGPVKQNGDINAQLTMQMGGTSKSMYLQGKIADGSIILSDNEMRFVGRYNGGSISGGLSELGNGSIPQSYFTERGIYSMHYTGRTFSGIKVSFS